MLTVADRREGVGKICQNLADVIIICEHSLNNNCRYYTSKCNLSNILTQKIFLGV